VQRAAVVGRDDRHSGDPLVATRAENAQRDFTPVRDEYPFHRAEAYVALEFRA
jgi:hypothetical protein